MVLYTIVPECSIFPEDESTYSQHQTISVNGVSMMVQQSTAESEIIRVLSTDPQDYLKYQPGQKIRI